MSSVFATGADERYGYHLINLLGSLKANSDVFDRVVVFDLGLSPHQRTLLDQVRTADVRTVPAFAPRWREGRAWKTWIWTHVEGESIFWLDAGATLLRPLDKALAQIAERGYFVVSQGHPIGDSIPSDYYELYGFPREKADSVSIAAGIIGFRRSSDFFARVIEPTHRDCLEGRSIGFSPDESRRLNIGLDRNAEPKIRDCKHFRWDQTVLNLRFYLATADPVIADLDEYAGWQSRRDHPQQVIWSHRRQGNMAYLARVPYRRGAVLRGRAFGIAFRGRWWLRMHRRFFIGSTYLWKVRKIARSLSRSPG
ncbi:MAG: hypothetical protein ABR569_05105 [Gaiellaceae bacterium]